MGNRLTGTTVAQGELVLGLLPPSAYSRTTTFRKLGLIEYNGVLKVHSSLLNVVVRE